MKKRWQKVGVVGKKILWKAGIVWVGVLLWRIYIYICVYTYVYRLDLPPHSATVTTRIIAILVGNPYTSLFVTVTGWGVDQMYISQQDKNDGQSGINYQPVNYIAQSNGIKHSNSPTSLESMEKNISGNPSDLPPLTNKRLEAKK